MTSIDTDTRVERVTKLLINEINSKVYESGEKLPSIEQLSVMLGAGRSTVREAIKELQTLGVLVIKHGGGTYVCEYEDSSPNSSFYQQTLESRRCVETFCAKNAALKQNDTLIEGLRRLYDEMNEHIKRGDTDAFVECDRRFHYRITRFESNVLLIKYHTSLDLLFQNMQNRIVAIEGSPERAQEDHKRIIDAIASHNAEKAVEAVERHFASISNQLQSQEKQH